MDGRGPLVGTGFSLRRLEMPFWVRLLHAETYNLKFINAEHIGTQYTHFVNLHANGSIGTQCTHFVNLHANGPTDAKSVYPSRHLKTEWGALNI